MLRFKLNHVIKRAPAILNLIIQKQSEVVSINTSLSKFGQNGEVLQICDDWNGQQMAFSVTKSGV